MKLAILSCVAFSLVGCVSIQSPSDMTHQDKVRLIHDSARAATFTALNQVDEEDRVEKAEELLELTGQAIEIINGTSPIGTETSEFLLSQIPTEYEVWLSLAMSTFNAHFVSPEVGELLSLEKRELLAALFEGVRDGAKEFVQE